MIKVANLAKSKIVRDFGLTLGGNLTTTLLGSLGGILAARLLGPEGRGELAAAVVWATVFSVIAQIALPQSLTYFSAREPGQIGTIFVTALVLLVIQSVVILAIGSLVVTGILWNVQSGNMGLVQIYLFSIPFLLLNTYLSAMCQGLKRFDLFNSLRTMMALGYVFTMGIASILGMREVRAVILFLLGVQATVSLLSLAIVVTRIRPRGQFSRVWAARLCGYGFRSYWGSLSWMANARLDQFLMSIFLASSELGQYAVAVSYASLLFPISGAFASTLFAYSSGDRPERAQSRIWTTLKLNLATAVVGTLLLGLLCPAVLPFLFGAEYQPSVQPAIILLAGTVFLGGTYVLSDGLRGLGKPGIVSLAEIAGVVMTVAGLLVTIPRLGIYGAAWTSVVSYALVYLLLFVVFRRQKHSIMTAGHS